MKKIGAFCSVLDRVSLRGETYIGLATTVGIGPLSGRRLNSSRLRHAEIQKIEYLMSVHDREIVSVVMIGPLPESNGFDVILVFVD